MAFFAIIATRERKEETQKKSREKKSKINREKKRRYLSLGRVRT